MWVEVFRPTENKSLSELRPHTKSKLASLANEFNESLYDVVAVEEDSVDSWSMEIQQVKLKNHPFEGEVSQIYMAQQIYYS